MTYLNYEVFDKAVIIDPIFKKLDKRLATSGRTWSARQLLEVKCYAQDARDFFKDILLESLDTFEDYDIDDKSYPPIQVLYPFTEAFGDPFLAVVHERQLESVEKLVCLILFSEHIIAYCDTVTSASASASASASSACTSGASGAPASVAQLPPSLVGRVLDSSDSSPRKEQIEAGSPKIDYEEAYRMLDSYVQSLDSDSSDSGHNGDSTLDQSTIVELGHLFDDKRALQQVAGH